jgi:hypothetical protein
LKKRAKRRLRKRKINRIVINRSLNFKGNQSNESCNFNNQNKVSQYLEQQDLFNKLMSERGIHIKRVNPENQSSGSSGEQFSGIASFGESSR